MNTVQTEVESNVDGIWFEDDCGKWDRFSCKHVGWINFIQDDGEMLMIVTIGTFSKGETFSKFPEEINFILDSIRPRY